jgi:hypothetical protein
MTKTEIKDYRKLLEKEYMDKDLEIETSVSYLSLGALGFFITINDKLLKLKTSECKIILILSLIFLFLSFVALLFRKSRTRRCDEKLMELIDNMESDSIQDDSKILSMWNEHHKKLSNIMTLIYYFLGIGIGLQILFLFLNF